MSKWQLLPRLIFSISSEERPRYQGWIAMEVSGKDTNHLAWFNHLWGELSSGSFPRHVDGATMMNWWEARFPHIPHRTRQMVRLNQDLCRYTENFLAYQKSREYKDNFHADLVFSLFERKAYPLFIRYYNQAQKRFQEFSHGDQDFRTMLSYNQLLRVGSSFQIYGKNNRFARGFHKPGPAFKTTIHEVTSALYMVERALFKLDENGSLSPMEEAALDILGKHTDKLPAYVPLMLTFFEILGRDDPPSEKQVRAIIDQLEPGLKWCRLDLVTNMMNLLIMKLANWERQVHRYDLLHARAETTRYLSRRGLIYFNRYYFLYIVRMYLESIHYVAPRLQRQPDPLRQKEIGKHLASAQTSLDLFGKLLPKDDQASSFRVMDLMVAFENEDDTRLERLFVQLAQHAFMDNRYEIFARWTKARYLFLKEDEYEFDLHVKVFDAYLRNHLKDDEGVDTAQHALNSLAFLKKMQNQTRLRNQGYKWLETIYREETTLLDKPWILAVMKHRLEAVR